MVIARSTAIATLILISATCSSQAMASSIRTFTLHWSGASYGNTAVGVGNITLDVDTLPNPTGINTNFFADFDPPTVLNFSIAISGATSGNGSFGQADYIAWGIGTYGNLLDFSHELVGQSTDGNPPWASTAGSEGSGDLQIFAINSDAPTGTGFFQMTTNGGLGDRMNLTGFTPVPEPSTLALLGLGGLGLAFGAYRKRRVAV